jgi:pimeloyl-ACP methyl ester carboxylesterase
MTTTTEHITIANSEIAFSLIHNFVDAPTVVFLHDSLGCIPLWRDFPKQLGELSRCNVLLYDRHGYGASGNFVKPKRQIDYLEDEAAVLIKLLETLNIQQPILFGHSDGGSIALIATAKYPGKITAVITEGAHIFVEAETLKGIREAIDQYQTTDLKTKLEKYHGDKTDAMFNAWTKTWTSDAFQSWTIENFLPLVQCPVLVIQGEKDEFGTIAQVDGIVNQVSRKATKAVLPGIQHNPHKENPELILTLTADFIKSNANRQQ